MNDWWNYLEHSGLGKAKVASLLREAANKIDSLQEVTAKNAGIQR